MSKGVQFAVISMGKVCYRLTKVYHNSQIYQKETFSPTLSCLVKTGYVVVFCLQSPSTNANLIY